MPINPLLKSKNTLSILFIAAEADPFVKIGGLGDVAGSLPLALKQLENSDPSSPRLDIRLAIPYYGMLHKPEIIAKKVASFLIPTIEEPVLAEVFETNLHGIPVYLIAGNPVLPDAPVYGSDFKKDAEKFIFFSLACLFLPEHINWQIDILHANDWHTAIANYQLQKLRKINAGYKDIRSILSLHNLPFMGTGSEKALEEFLISPAQNPRMPKWSRTLPLPMGLNTADKIIAVSPSYAREILTPDYGCDLQDFLKTKSKKLTGVLNGINVSLWNPETDPLIQQKYSITSLDQRINNKLGLQKELNLEQNPDIPLMAFIGRMDRQKGIDLAIEAIKKLKNLSWQMIFLGTGDKQLEADLMQLQASAPQKIRTALRFDAVLSHHIYAGSDILLMPSRYEPCGLAQLIAMHYGCIPVARSTGGLIDTIIDFDLDPSNATGFLFHDIEGASAAKKIKSALSIFQKKETWQQIQVKAMSQDFSWQQSAKKYLEIYQELI